MKPCLECKEPTTNTYKAFHWSAGGSYALVVNNKPLLHHIHKECYKAWYEKLIAGLAELDEVMNYCKYFERTAGNEGNYVRDGKSFLVKGDWDGHHLFCKHEAPTHFLCCTMKPFGNFLKENGWGNNWFELKDKYKALTAVV